MRRPDPCEQLTIGEHMVLTTALDLVIGTCSD